jgi:cytochrome c biogenesis protein CcmG/thiol:disulfide interchange protein DsbE
MVKIYLKAVVAALTAAVLMLPFSSTAAEAAGREGEIVPFFKTRDTSGTELDLKGMARENNAVVLFFWHSYKTMSIREMNFLNDMYRFYNLYGMEIVGIEGGGKESAGVVEELDKLAIIGTKPVYTVVPDPGGRLARQYGIDDIPETFIIGRGGRIVFHLKGFREGDRARLETKIKEILNLLPAPSVVKEEDGTPVTKRAPRRKVTVSVDPVQQRMEKCSYFGRYYLNLGNLDGALEHYLQCVEIDPDDVATQLRIGEVYVRKKDYERAREAWERVLELDPGNSEAGSLIRKLVRGEF